MGVERNRVLAAGAVALVAFVVVATVVADRDAAPSDPRYFRADAAVPAEFQPLIVEAGTACPESEHVTPLLVAAILKATSDFDADLDDPATHENGIARWTQSMLREYLPAGERTELPAPPFPPEVSIPALGEFLCRHTSEAAGHPRGPELGLAFGFRTSVVRGEETFGTEAVWTGDSAYLSRVEQALADYRP
ncbi:hypothetical protein [Catenuloplanes japonicus]|uniref:hypothetical protein n=1 Tax=Catenuloplanes japonicus TaxID=33876 RepID=UPI000524A8CF|nr:hypothetical protein [Catenuloplanes japonicus]